MNPAMETPVAAAPPLPLVQKPTYRSTDTVSLLDLIVDETTKRDLVNMEVENKRFEMNGRIANVMANAGYFYAGGDDSKNKMTLDQAMAKIEIGRAWGLSAADSIRFVYVVNGKPTLENEICAARMMDAGWSWEVEWIGEQGPKCKGVKLWVSYRGQAVLDRKGNPVFVEFNEAMAQTAGLLDKSGPWKTYRSNMYFWRTIANMRRIHCPNVLSGAMTRDEALDISELDISPGSDETPVRRKLARQLEERGVPAAASEPAEAQAEAQQEEPKTIDVLPSPELLKKIAAMEPALSTEVWSGIMANRNFKRVSDIKSDLTANDTLAEMRAALREVKK